MDRFIESRRRMTVINNRDRRFRGSVLPLIPRPYPSRPDNTKRSRFPSVAFFRFVRSPRRPRRFIVARGRRTKEAASRTPLIPGTSGIMFVFGREIRIQFRTVGGGGEVEARKYAPGPRKRPPYPATNNTRNYINVGGYSRACVVFVGPHIYIYTRAIYFPLFARTRTVLTF